jgi:hypothetical protein
MNKQFVLKLDNFQVLKEEVSLLEKEDDNNLITSSTINLPLISLGFHSFIHRTKSAISITDKLQTKNKFYMVVNPFEPELQNYEDSLKNLIKSYLNYGGKEDKDEFNSPEFYEMWEILFLFNMADKKDLVSAILSDNPKVYNSALEYFTSKLTTIDSKVYNITQSGGSEPIDNNLEGGGKKRKSRGGGSTNIEISKIKDKVDLIIATTYINNETGFLFTEQENYKYIISRLISVLQIQGNKGSLILKIDETFTLPSIKLLYIINYLYDYMYIYKPCFSKYTNANKYLICSGFKQSSDGYKKLLKSLQNILDNMNKYSNKFVYDIYPDLQIPRDFLNKIKFCNIKLTNQEQIMINDIISYIKNNNYFGEDYHKYRNNQIQLTKWWIEHYLPPSKNLYDKAKEDNNKELKQTLEKYNMELSKFIGLIM